MTGRVFITLFGLCGIAAGAALLFVSPHHQIVDIGERILKGERYSPEAIEQMAPIAQQTERDRFASAAARRGDVIFRFEAARLAAGTGDPAMIDRTADALSSSVRTALAASPTDPFLWLVLFWSENTREGFSPDHLDALRLSYRFGPNEGWVILRRSPVALALFSFLPPDLATSATDDLLNAMKNGMYKETANLLIGPGRSALGELLPRLASKAPPDQIHDLGEALDLLGYTLDIPGARIEPRKS